MAGARFGDEDDGLTGGPHLSASEREKERSGEVRGLILVVLGCCAEGKMDCGWAGWLGWLARAALFYFFLT